MKSRIFRVAIQKRCTATFVLFEGDKSTDVSYMSSAAQFTMQAAVNMIQIS